MLKLVTKWDSLLEELNDIRSQIADERLLSLKAETEREIPHASGSELESLHSALALIHYRLHDRKGQLVHTRALAQLRPWSLLAQRNYAANLLEVGEVDEGIRIMEQVVTHAGPDRSRTYGDLSLALLRKGQGEQAVCALRNAVRYADYSSHRDLFSLAAHSAQLGFHKQALEFLARYLALSFNVELGKLSAEAIVRETVRNAPGQLWLAFRVPALRLAILQALVFDAEHSGIPWSELERETVPDSVAANSLRVMDWMAPLSNEATNHAIEGGGESK